MAKLYFRYSAMNAGKSTALIQVAHNYEADLGEGVLVFSPQTDSRYGVGRITSRLGISIEAKTLGPLDLVIPTIESSLDVLSLITDKSGLFIDGGKRLGCILVDEAQFLSPSQVREFHRFAHVCSIPVICYGIRTDFLGNVFPGASALLSLADAIEEVKTVCFRCKSRKATMNPRIDSRGERVFIGDQIGIEGAEHQYSPMCAKCFYECDPASLSLSS